MNFREFIIPILLGLGITVALRYYLGNPPFGATQEPEVPGQRYAAPKELKKPLNREVDFVDQPTNVAEQLTTVATNYGQLVFSNHGGSLRTAVYKRTTDNTQIKLETIHPRAEIDRAQSFFLVALDEQTPYFYSLGELVETASAVRVQYRAETTVGTIEKLFTVDKNNYQIDLALTIKPHAEDKPLHPRLIYASPFIIDNTRAETVSGVMEEQRAVTQYPLVRYRAELDENFWLAPSVFGAEDRYFIHALVRDHQQFVQRAYYRVGVEYLYPILEGPVVKKEMTWNLSFFVGPKEHEAFMAVDPRLEDTLDYGWLSFMAKPMLRMLKWLAQYLHSFGWAIIVFTLLLRLLLLPLSWRTTKTAQQAQEMQKKMTYLKSRYKDDPETLQREQAALIQKYGMASLGGLGAGCLPLLLQLPIFFAMNRVLSSSIELYRAPFLWITDLSSKDPYYILPVLVSASMLVAMLQSGDKQQRVSGVVMALFFGAFAVGFSAGLSLFFIVSTLVGVIPMLVQRQGAR